MYFIPMGMLLKASGHIVTNIDAISWVGFASNLIPVILGNLIGGSVFVGFVYYIIYLRNRHKEL
jgi:formate/nitrite transporter FocA (FNT family)